MGAPLSEATDEELMALYQEGEIEAFTELFGRYERMLYNFFLRRVRDTSLSEDLYQKTFLRLHQARDRFETSRAFRPWLFTIAYNLYRDELKKKASSKETVTESSPESAWDAEPAPETDALNQELSTRVRAAVASLPDVQREVIELSRFEGCSYAEIGKITGKSANAVKQAAHRAMRGLRERLASFFQEAS